MIYFHLTKGETLEKGICQVHRCSNFAQPDCDMALNNLKVFDENDILYSGRVCTRYSFYNKAEHHIRHIISKLFCNIIDCIPFY